MIKTLGHTLRVFFLPKCYYFNTHPFALTIYSSQYDTPHMNKLQGPLSRDVNICLAPTEEPQVCTPFQSAPASKTKPLNFRVHKKTEAPCAKERQTLKAIFERHISHFDDIVARESI